MIVDLKDKLAEHIDEFGAVIPYELTVSETFIVYGLLLRLEELEDDYFNMIGSECGKGCIYCSKGKFESHLDKVLGDSDE